MIVSDARREANRRNAAKSTGPKTAEGKATACRNSWKHGFTAGSGRLDQADGGADRLAAWQGEFRPRGDWQGWLVAELAGVSVRLERIAASEVLARSMAARRAESLWDEDRRREVEQVGARLEREPAVVVATLRQSPHGCDWLIERWAALARLADEAGPAGWDEAATRLALNLLGAPEVGRIGSVGVIIDELGQIHGPALSPTALTRQQIGDLQALRDRAGEADDLARTMAAAGLSDIPSREVANLRRYEQATLRRLFWLSGQIKEAGLQAQPGMDQTDRNDRSLPDQTPAPIPVEVPTGRAERNEPISAPRSNETKPSRAGFIPAPGGFPTDLFEKPVSGSTRKRPDLARFARDRREYRSA